MKTFDAECPETFNWDIVRQSSLSQSARVIAQAIYRDLQTEECSLVPGLREALRLIARAANA